MPAFIALLLFALLGACQALPPVDPSPAATVDAARALFAEAAQADQAGDAEAALAAVQQAVALRPNHPTLLYNAAALEAQAGLTAQARLRLGKLARMGVGTDVRAQPAFETLHGDAAFERVADELARNAEPYGTSPLVHALGSEHAGVLPEGLLRMKEGSSWWFSTVAAGQLLDETGAVVVQDEHGRGFFGMQHDVGRDVVWVAAALPPGRATGDSAGRSALYRGKTNPAVWDSHPVPGEQPAALGDVLVRTNGEVLTSDAEGGTIWRVIDPDGWESSREGPWLEPWLQGALLPSPQGMAEAAGFVYLADYSTGLHRMDDDGERRPLIKPEDLCDLGIDGLAAAGDRHLVAIQNGFAPQRILWLTLSDDGTTITDWQVLAAGLPEWREPTLGLVHEGWFYFIANSHWPDFADFENPQGEQSPPQIRKLKLPR